MTKKTRLRPTFERILIERDPEETITAGGIVVPDASVSRPAQGQIVDMGPGVFTGEMKASLLDGIDSNFPVDEVIRIRRIQTFDLGEIVRFPTFSGTEMIIDEKTYVLLLQDEVTSKAEYVNVDDDGNIVNEEVV